MTTRSRKEAITFKRPFYLKSVGRLLPAGTYTIVSEDELIEGISLPRYRRTGTFIMASSGSSQEMLQVDPRELDYAKQAEM